MAALTVVLALASIYIPVIGTVTYLVWTLPTVAMCMRHGFLSGLLTIVVSALIMMLLVNPVTAIGIIINCAGPALMLGVCLKKNYSTAMTLVSVTIVTAISMLASYCFDAALAGISLIDEILLFQETFRESYTELMPLYESLGLLEQLGITSEQFMAEIDAALNIIKYILPIIFCITSMLTAFVNYYLATKIFKRLKIGVRPVTGFSYFRLPEKAIYAFIIAFGATLFFAMQNDLNSVILQGAINLLIFMAFLYLLQGVSLIWYWSGKQPMGFKFMVRIFLVVILTTANILVLGIVAILGIVDVFADFRHIRDGIYVEGETI